MHHLAQEIGEGICIPLESVIYNTGLYFTCNILEHKVSVQKLKRIAYKATGGSCQSRVLIRCELYDLLTSMTLHPLCDLQIF